MKGQSTGPSLSALFVDYDNIYLSLKRKNEEAAKRFAKDAALWLREVDLGRLITPTNGLPSVAARRIVMNRCYGNPVPRRNATDNSTDMNSFPFVRHHFLRAGFEVIDCPPLTAQLKNSADIRMVLDVLEFLNHNTYFDEFIILSGDADFTPVLHKLRAHARRTVVFANDHTAAPYTAISDGEVREADLIQLLLEGRATSEAEPNNTALPSPTSSAQIEANRRDIVAEVVGSVRAAGQPVSLEALADRAVRTLGHDKTVGSSWGGAGSFRDLLVKGLPDDVRLSDQPPYYVFDASRQIAAPAPERRIEARTERPQAPMPEPLPERHIEARYERASAPAPIAEPAPAPAATQRAAPQLPAVAASAYAAPRQPLAPSYDPPPAPPVQPRAAAQQMPLLQQPQAQLTQQTRSSEAANAAIQQSIARIHEACQAPPLSPPEYRVLFDALAEEINTNSLSGAQTLINIAQRAREMGVEIKREDVRFVLEVVSEADPWFEQGASPNLFASRFRNFVVARCRTQGLSLSSDELDLIEAWFGGSPAAQRPAAGYARTPGQNPAPAPRDLPQSAQTASAPAAASPARQEAARNERWWSLDEGRQHVAESRAQGFGTDPDDEFPRIIRTRLRG